CAGIRHPHGAWRSILRTDELSDPRRQRLFVSQADHDPDRISPALVESQRDRRIESGGPAQSIWTPWMSSRLGSPTVLYTDAPMSEQLNDSQAGRPSIHRSEWSQAADMFESLRHRLQTLAGTEDLQGFSLREMFSQVLRRRTEEELDDYFIVGTYRTT